MCGRRRGGEVGLNCRRAQIELKPGNKLRIEQIWDKVLKNGNSPRETRVVVESKVVSSGGTLQLEVIESGKPYDLVPGFPGLEQEVGKRLMLEGVMTAPKPETPAAAIQVIQIRSR